MRIMAVDYGDARTGVAFSDPTGSIAGEAFVIAERYPERLAKKLREAAQMRGAQIAVLGRPLNMNGTAGPRAEKSEALAGLLRAQGLEVILWDERRTTVDAHRILSESGKRMKDHKETVDAVAASLILEGYLSRISQK